MVPESIPVFHASRAVRLGRIADPAIGSPRAGVAEQETGGDGSGLRRVRRRHSCSTRGIRRSRDYFWRNGQFACALAWLVCSPTTHAGEAWAGLWAGDRKRQPCLPDIAADICYLP